MIWVWTVRTKTYIETETKTGTETGTETNTLIDDMGVDGEDKDRD